MVIFEMLFELLNDNLQSYNIFKVAVVSKSAIRLNRGFEHTLYMAAADVKRQVRSEIVM
jgi:hypothetical protein